VADNFLSNPETKTQAEVLYQKIQSKIEELPFGEYSFSEEDSYHRLGKIRTLIQHELLKTEDPIQQRVLAEFYGYGPLELLFENRFLTEILVIDLNSIWIEFHGKLSQFPDSFFSELSFRNIIEKICQTSGAHITLENPYFDGAFQDFRLTLVGPGMTHQKTQLSFRRHPKNPWTLTKLLEAQWCQSKDLAILQKIFISRQNFIVVGPTSSGKTSVLNAMLGLCKDNERIIAIEDTPELHLPNSASTRLLTREDPQKVLPSIDQNQLVRTSLRLRPDRIVMGEMRGPEAKDFLMALATGHRGSFGSLHAETPHQALLRLEMLIQLGAPQWNIDALRKLIFMSLNCIIVTEYKNGQRQLQGIYRIASLEETGFTIENWT